MTKFVETIRDALIHTDDVGWLGGESSLSTPYFLGNLYENDTLILDVEARGYMLRDLMWSIHESMWQMKGLKFCRLDYDELCNIVANKRGMLEQDKNNMLLWFYLLELRYFRRFYRRNRKPKSSKEIYEYLGIGRATYFRYVEKAVEWFGEQVLRETRPSLRLESPRSQIELLGREDIYRSAMKTLVNKGSVAFTGTGGVGKTALGMRVLDEWQSNQRFWFTFRLGLNDNVNSVLTALGHFLHHQCGASALWQQIAAEREQQINPVIALGLLRRDMEQVADQQLLLCFDEVDGLRTEEQDEAAEHCRLIELINSIKTYAGLLLIGQRVQNDTDAPFVLPELDEADADRLLKRRGLNLKPAVLKKIYAYAGGIPRTTELVGHLLERGDSLDEIVQMSHESLAPLFYRLWRKLDEAERFVLSHLACFRVFVPETSFSEFEDAVNRLRDRQIIREDGRGGIAILVYMRHLIYKEMRVDRRKRRHESASAIRSINGEFTQAAFHLVQSGQEKEAIDLWHGQMDNELGRGQSEPAFNIFGSLDPNEFDKEIAEKLKEIQNRLRLMKGDYVEIISNYDGEKNPRLILQTSKANDFFGNIDEAHSLYAETIRILEEQIQATNLLINTHLSRGRLFVRSNDLVGARRERDRATLIAEMLSGLVETASTEFKKALIHYENALLLAEALSDKMMISELAFLLMNTKSTLGLYEVALEHGQNALDMSQKMGNLVNAMLIQAELAGVYMRAGEYREAIKLLEPAYDFFERIKFQYLISSVAANLGESYFELKDYNEAVRWANIAVNLEESSIQPYAIFTLGRVYAHHNSPDQAKRAKDAYDLGIQIAQDIDDIYIEAFLHQHLGILHRGQEDLINAKKELEIALCLFTKMEIADEIEETKKLIESLLVRS